MPTARVRAHSQFTLNETTKRYDDHTVLDGATLAISPGDRVGVIGDNGSGKTTLLRVLTGDTVPDAGRVSVSGRVGYLRQEDGSTASGQTVLQAYASVRPGCVEDHHDELASLGLFRVREMDQPVETLSVGQRRRIEVARLTSGAYDLLLLDEPTNHLSPGLVEDLEEALTHYGGTLVVVSHDRRTRERFTGRRLELRGGSVVSDSA